MSIYLSRLVLDARSTAVRRDLGDCRGLHRTVLSAFPAAPSPEGARAHFGVLYRVEPEAEGRGSARVLLVQSAVEPDWGRLPPGYLQEGACKRVDAYYAGEGRGAVLSFRLRANPTRRVSATGERGAHWRG